VKHFSLILASLLMFMALPAFADKHFVDETIEEKKFEFIVHQACKDIFANTDILIATRKESDAAFSLIWQFSVARNIPIQPVAVISLYTILGSDPTDECSLPFIEENIETAIVWSRRSIDALQSFTMNGEKEEQMRRACLSNIEAIYLKMIEEAEKVK